MPRSIRHVAAARRDLIAIHRYIAREGTEEAADRLLRRIGDLLSKLTEHPEIGVARPELALNIRSFPIGRYLIFYDVSPDLIRLIRVVHASQDISPEYFADPN